MPDYTDEDTVPLTLTPSDSQEFVGTDAATANLRFTVSSADVYAATDSATVNLRFTVSAVEGRQQYDIGTVYLKLTPSGIDVFTRLIPLLVGVSLKNLYYVSSELFARFYSPYILQTRWDIQRFGKA